jgi:hypothetical protein
MVGTSGRNRPVSVTGYPVKPEKVQQERHSSLASGQLPPSVWSSPQWSRREWRSLRYCRPPHVPSHAPASQPRGGGKSCRIPEHGLEAEHVCRIRTEHKTQSKMPEPLCARTIQMLQLEHVGHSSISSDADRISNEALFVLLHLENFGLHGMRVSRHTPQ